VLHVAGGFAQHPLYAQLTGQLDALGNSQTVYAPVRTAREASFRLPDHGHSIECYIQQILRPPHRVFFRTKIRTIYRDIVDNVDTSKFDLIHAHTLFSDGAVSLKLHRRFNIPYIVAVRNTDINWFMRYRPDLRRIMLAVIRDASRIVFLSPSYRDQLLSRLPSTYRNIVASKSIILGNGLDSFWLEDDQADRPPEPLLRVLYVGSFSKNKNVASILQATKTLSRERPIELTLVGSGGDQESPVRNAVDNGTFPFARYLGRIDDREELRDIYREHDIFVMPSFRESFGVAYIEAISQGLPVVHSRGQGVDGYFEMNTVSEAVDPRSTADIAEAIVKLAQRLARVRSLCRQEARRFSWRGIALSYDEMYREISSR
jgi:glycosyltransferase involved in cell wall biosynthesis